MLTFTAAEAERLVAAVLLPFLRIVALMSSAPIYSHASLPRPVRIGLAAAAALLIAPTLPAPPPVPLASGGGALLALQQVVIGLAIGFVIQIVFAAVQLAGDVIGLQMGLSFASFVDPQNQQPAPIVGSLLNVAVLLVFLALDGHLMLLAALGESFSRWPIGTAPGWNDALAIARSGSTLFQLGLKIALPVVGALLIVNLALGLLARTAPQLNLFAVGFPVTLITGMAALLVALPALLPMAERAIAAAVSGIAR